MKRIIPFLLVAFPFVSFAQADTAAIVIPMQKGKVFYEKTYSTGNRFTKDELFAKATQWFKTSFNSSETPLDFTSNPASGELSGNGIFKVITSDGGNYYWVKPTIHLTIKSDGYTFQVYDFYEKPIEKGVTNEYSKLEYRWRDFRKGKPWSQEDRRLFKGIAENTNSLMTSFENKMNQ